MEAAPRGGGDRDGADALVAFDAFDAGVLERRASARGGAARRPERCKRAWCATTGGSRPGAAARRADGRASESTSTAGVEGIAEVTAGDARRA
jgi:hypothetical protein